MYEERTMKSNKEIVYDFILNYFTSNVTDEVQGVSTSLLSEELHMQRTNISALLNTLVKENRIEKLNGRPVLYRLINMPNMNSKEQSCFKKLSGHDGSLKNAVQLAKAAILYPQHNLHTLILGPSGSGKSYFASLMYEFAMEHNIIKNDAPFIKFNCRLYEDCENELCFHLFGNEGNAVQSAFHQASGGVLFIDHIDVLTAPARDALFGIMEQEKHEGQDVIIICATNDSINTTLKETFMAKFSVNILLPSLQSRNMEERLALIQTFFTNEAMKMKRVIKINSELLRCVLLYHCENNVKQLKMDIKIGCANAYVREFNTAIDELHIYIHDFPAYVRKGFLYYKDYRDIIEHLIPQNYSYTFSSELMEKIKDSFPLRKETSETVYDIIERKARELRERGIIEEDINTIVSVDIESDFRMINNKLVNAHVNKESLAKIVDDKIIHLVEQFLNQASERFGKVYPVSTFYGLCLHLSATLERANKAQHLPNNKIMEIVETYKDEYIFCMNFASKLEKEFNFRLPIDEVVFITMFLCDKSLQTQAIKKPVVLVAMHGESTASSIANVVNTLVKGNTTYAYNLSLDKDMQVAYEELKCYIKEIDQGKGVLMLYDMGSLKTMGEMIAQETGIRIRMVETPATLIALDCSRKASCDTSLDNVFESVMESYQQSFSFLKDSYHRQTNSSVIITLCMSGKGAALQMKQYLEKHIDMEKLDILPYAISDREHLLSEINTIKKDANILCVIGTYDPQLFGIPFISISKLFDTPEEKLPMLLALEDMEGEIDIDYDAIYNYLSEQLPTIDIRVLKKYLPKVILKIKKTVHGLSQDQELGLFMHIACSLHRMLAEEKMPANIHREAILQKNKRLYNDIKDILQPLEEEFEVIFHDDEIANIICIIKQL